MRNFLTLIYIVMCNVLFAQKLPYNYNLVPNSGFEFGYSVFNTSLPQYAFYSDSTIASSSNCWIRANTHPLYVVPATSQTPQEPYPHSGQKLSGILLVIDSLYTLPDTTRSGYQGLRSYAQTQLLEPLEANQLYYFSIYVGCSRNTDIRFNSLNGGVIKNIGILFSDTAVYYAGPILKVTMLPYKPQINFSGWTMPNVYDTFVYVRLSATYVAKGGEHFMTIGNFDSIKHFSVYHLSPHTVGNTMHKDDVAVLFIDDIYLSKVPEEKVINTTNWSLGNDTVICTDEHGNNPPLALGNNPNFFSYLWNTGDTTSKITVNESGTYWCTINYGCNTFTDTIQVFYIHDSLPQIFIGADTGICTALYTYDTLLLDIETCIGCNYLWSTGESTPSIFINQPGRYWVRVSNLCGKVSDTIQVEGCKDSAIIILLPNAFSPNGDGVNDFFNIRYLPVMVKSAEMIIYNRWGQKAAVITDVKKGWDGANAEVGTYFYYLKYTNHFNEVFYQKGELNLLR